MVNRVTRHLRSLFLLGALAGGMGSSPSPSRADTDFDDLPCGAPIPGSFLIDNNHSRGARAMSEPAAALALQQLGASEERDFQARRYGIKLVKMAHPHDEDLVRLRDLFGEGVMPNRKVCVEDTLRGSVASAENPMPPVDIAVTTSGGFLFRSPQLPPLSLGQPISSTTCGGGSSLGRIFVDDYPTSDDGLPDVIGLAECADSARLGTVAVVYCNEGNGLPSYEVCDYYQLGTDGVRTEGELKDVTGDGKPDLIMLNDSDVTGWGARIYYGLAERSPAYLNIPLSHRPDRMLMRDFTGDGRDDLVIASTGGGQLSLVYLRNQGGGAFQRVAEVTGELPATEIALMASDINLDGRLDIGVFATTTTFKYFSFFTQRPDGTFNQGELGEEIWGLWSNAPEMMNDRDAVTAFASDITGDGLDDLFLLGRRGNDSRILIFRHSGDPSDPFLSVAGMTLATSANDLILRDYDGDGDRDLMVPSSNSLLRLRNFSVESGRQLGLNEMFDLDTPDGELAGIRTLATAPSQGIAHARVEALHQGTGTVYSTTTDGHGNFEISNVLPGTYSLTASRSYFKALPPIVRSVIGTLANVVVPARRAPPDALGAPSPLPATYPNDEGVTHLWGLMNYGQQNGTSDIDVDAVEAWRYSTGSDDLVVGVIDTGIDYTHPDLVDNIWANPGEIPGNGVDDDANGLVDDVHGYSFVNNSGFALDFFGGHGTHVAGTIGARGANAFGVVGINHHVKLMALQALSTVSGSGSDATILSALSHALTMKLRGVNIRVLNLSLGGPGTCPPQYQTILSALNDAGVFVVFAAGNEATNNDVIPRSPASCSLPNTITVAAVDRFGNLADFSNFGPSSVHIAAPGVDILSTWPGAGYKSISGTSMATPHVAGIAALLLSKEPSLTPAEVRTRLIETRKPLAHLTGRMTYPGIVSAVNAIAAALPPGGGDTGGGDGAGNGGGGAGGTTGQPPAIADLKIKVSKKEGSNKVTAKVMSVIISDADGAVTNARVVISASTAKKAGAGALARTKDGLYAGKASVKLSKKSKKPTKRVAVTIEATDDQGNVSTYVKQVKVKRAK